MVIAYHVIFTTYGTWLPNDPRGSFCQQVYNDELRAIAPIRHGHPDPQPTKDELRRFKAAALPTLDRPPYFLDSFTRPAVAAAFGQVVDRFGLFVPACAIMNDHVHILLMAGERRIEYLVGQLKAQATAALRVQETPWARRAWKVFLYDEEALAAAIRYVELNPVRAGLPSQEWPFVTPREA